MSVKIKLYLCLSQHRVRGYKLRPPEQCVRRNFIQFDEAYGGVDTLLGDSSSLLASNEDSGKNTAHITETSWYSSETPDAATKKRNGPRRFRIKTQRKLHSAERSLSRALGQNSLLEIYDYYEQSGKLFFA
jgi:hypothetical protein